MVDKVHTGRYGDSLEVEAGGVVTVRSGGRIALDSGAVLDLASGAKLAISGAQPAALTAQLTTITHTAPGTPDYALQNLTDTGGFGFASADEGNSVLKVIANLQARCAEMEARMESLGIVIAN